MEISQTQVHTAPRLTSSNLHQRETEKVLELPWTCDGVSILQFSARVKEKNTSVNSKLPKPAMDTQAKRLSCVTHIILCNATFTYTDRRQCSLDSLYLVKEEIQTKLTFRALALCHFTLRNLHHQLS